jgi:hypothetical protein
MRYQNSQGGPYLYEFACPKPQGFGVSIEKIVLMHPGVSTHSGNFQQRYVELQIAYIEEDVPGNNIVLTMFSPPSVKHAPPGYYMAFAVTNQGTPSVATWIKLVP